MPFRNTAIRHTGGADPFETMGFDALVWIRERHFTHFDVPEERDLTAVPLAQVTPGDARAVELLENMTTNTKHTNKPKQNKTKQNETTKPED